LSGKESRTGNLLKEEKDRKFEERRGGQVICYEGEEDRKFVKKKKEGRKFVKRRERQEI